MFARIHRLAGFGRLLLQRTMLMGRVKKIADEPKCDDIMLESTHPPIYHTATPLAKAISSRRVTFRISSLGRITWEN